MLSKSKIKFFNSIKLRKYRKKHKLFVAEGKKIIKDLVDSGFVVKYIVAEKNDFDFKLNSYAELILTESSEFKKISSLKTVPDAIAYFQIPEYNLEYNNLKDELTLFCDGIQNPGNMGSIIRTADWFGISNIICSEDTVDIYNPKVVQASMGAIARVKVHYVDKVYFFDRIEGNIYVYGTLPEGEDLYKTNLKKEGIIVVGNEGSGISGELLKYVSKKISIPNFSNKENKTESLNASIATAVVCAEFMRQNKKEEN
ncbi:MAG: RNA methyltransferase [Bacteroidales bacterium]|nr:RNA methyltransferase [Bacteroidales bacterium]